MSDRAHSVELLLHSGVVHTLDASSTRAQAIAIGAGRVLATGRRVDLAAMCGPQTRLIDLAGRAVVPGLFDAHPHLDRLGLRDRVGLSIAHCESVSDIVQTIREAAARTPAGQWIVTQPRRPSMHRCPCARCAGWRSMSRRRHHSSLSACSVWA